MKILIFILSILLSFTIPSSSQQCGNAADAVGAAWDFYEDNVPSFHPAIAISKLFDDIVELYNNFPNNGPGKAGYRGLNIPTHQPQTGTTIGIGARVWLTPPSQDPHVEITVKKTGGKAKTHIDVCITGKNLIQEHVKSYTFEKDAPNHSKTFVLKKVKDHIISVRINPKFGTNKFEYEISTSSQKAMVEDEEPSTSDHPSGLTASDPVSKAGSGSGIVRNFNTSTESMDGTSEHPSGLTASDPVSRAESGSGIVRNFNPHPENIDRTPEHEVGGTYTMTMFNKRGHIVSTGTVVINHEEIPWLMTIIPDNGDTKFIKVRGEFRNNTFRGALEDDASRKVALKFDPDKKEFIGEIRNLLPNASFKAVKMKLVKK